MGRKAAMDNSWSRLAYVYRLCIWAASAVCSGLVLDLLGYKCSQKSYNSIPTLDSSLPIASFRTRMSSFI